MALFLYILQFSINFRHLVINPEMLHLLWNNNFTVRSFTGMTGRLQLFQAAGLSHSPSMWSLIKWARDLTHVSWRFHLSSKLLSIALSDVSILPNIEMILFSPHHGIFIILHQLASFLPPFLSTFPIHHIIIIKGASKWWFSYKIFYIRRNLNLSSDFPL